jgi:diguanylate cyclase (GGDEF)-like protein
VLDKQVQQEWRRAARQGQPLGLLMADIDDFKAYNDHYGHIQGDICLQEVAHALAESLTRAGDTVARYGGEEFAVLLPGSTFEAAVALGEMSAAAVRALSLVHAYSSAAPYVTLSIGATSVIPPARQQALGQRDGASANAPESGFYDARALFEAADRALYQAKREGRDRVRASPTGLLDY